MEGMVRRQPRRSQTLNLILSLTPGVYDLRTFLFTGQTNLSRDAKKKPDRTQSPMG